MLVALALLSFVTSATAEIRFPPPEFESGYVMPTTQNPLPRALWFEYLDVAVLALTLGLATWIVYRKRSRRWVMGLAAFSLLYFGFYREGCVCAIGSVQNVAFGLFNTGYALPFVVLAFFALPLVIALFFGRTFCSAVCPHGALQDLLLIKPVKVPVWLERGLGVVPFVYLGLAVMFAALGAGFIICQYDPFIPVFRLTGSAGALALSATFLVLALFVGRPYCRFACPYGALLRMASAVAKWRVRITPDTCTQCRLCPDTCPFGVIREPTAPLSGSSRLPGRRRIAWLLVTLPLLIAFGGWVGSRFGDALARVNPHVAHAEWLARPNAANEAASAPLLPPVPSLKSASLDQVLPAAIEARQRFHVAGWLLGGWVGIVIGVRLVGLSAGIRRTEFEPEQAGCFACARCFEYCPQERAKLGLPVSPVSPTARVPETSQRNPAAEALAR